RIVPTPFDLLTHHFASCVLSFKTIPWRCPYVLLRFGQLILNTLQQDPVPLGQHNAEFVQQTTQGVGLHEAHLHELSTHTMQSQAGLLLLTFDWHSLDVKLLRSYPDAL